MSRYRLVVGISGIALLLGLSGCAGKAPSAADVSRASAVQSRLDEQMSLAKANQFDILSPDNYKNAMDAYTEARAINAKSPGDPDFFRKATEAQQSLIKADQVAKVSGPLFNPTLNARQMAIATGAPQIQKKEFSQADKNFRDAIGNIESSSLLPNAKQDQAKLTQQYDSIGRSTVTQRYLGGAMGTIQTAKNEGAAEYAPTALGNAENSVKQAQDVIMKDPLNTAAITVAASAATQQANYALQATRESRDIAMLSPEEKLKRKNELEAQLQSQQAKGRGVASMKDAAARSERLRMAAAAFTPDQANVFATDDHLVIQLKGIDFKSGKADIPASDFPLLSKVVDIIKQMPEGATFSVLGHTDSTGSNKINQPLSEKRADAVKSYLVSSGNIPSQRIATRGLASSKPVATDETKAGRADNRRVDVVITNY
jgi:outer membrane protein OmpA-like peptidoglycan-associated protein